MIKDHRAILRANIRALPIQSCRIVNGEKYFQNFPKRDNIGVECEPDNFGMTGRARADLPIGRVRHGAARIARLDLFYALELVIHRFQAPKAAAAQGCHFFLSQVRFLSHHRHPSKHVQLEL